MNQAIKHLSPELQAAFARVNELIDQRTKELEKKIKEETIKMQTTENYILDLTTLYNLD